MKQITPIVTAACLLAGALVARAEWQPVSGNIMTKWAAQVDPSKPLPEYPRPQMVREEWISLNGLWDYAITPKDASQPAQFDGQILVPFCVESALSGVKKPVSHTQRLWYRRTFTAREVKGQRLLLHFGAVDWEAAVSLNGKPLGTHRGGYDAFSFDITDALKPGENELVVSVFDATGGIQARGKQSFGAIARPDGIFYTPCTGIWQTVWLEPVPAQAVESLKIVPDIDAGTVSVTVGGGTGAAQVTVLDGGKPVATGKGNSGEAIVLKVPEAKLWSPDTPFLYDLEVTLGADCVKSYFGMRKIALGKDEKGVLRPLLNNRFVFQSGPLDQGFWPDGIYTAPTDEALKFDLEITKKLGFNMTRKHVKVEPQRWYYWCDKLGLLVWQDMPGSGAGEGARKDKETGAALDGTAVSPEATRQFEGELKAMIEQHANHPSIITWIVFNEGWGQYETPRVTRYAKSLDPTRLVTNVSGFHDVKAGDLVDIHVYPGPSAPKPEPDRASVLGEFGGLGLPVPGHMWVENQKNWGYQNMVNPWMLTRKYQALWQKVFQLKETAALSAAVYTQLTDVETESNGLLSYDRKVTKINPAITSGVVRGEAPPPSVLKPVASTALEQPSPWRYTTAEPAPDWFKPEFDASAWSEGLAGFGNDALPPAKTATAWKTADIWLRREVTLPPDLKTPVLQIYYDDGAEVYLNGVLAAKFTGFTTTYETVPIAPEATATLKPGRTVIAVHCHQTTGGQYIDVGLTDLIEP